MIGDTVSHYRILEKIGEGGMGVVYKAQDTRLDRLVAIKVLAAHLSANENAKRRFIHEAKAASAIDHAHIATVHDIGETSDGKIFIVMGYYAGQTLSNKIAAGVLGVDEALSVVSQIADGLVEAHDKGIVHRDVKPANVIITDSGQVKVVDFGLTKLRAATKVTKSDTTVGTLSYMSPEQLRGDVVDARSDIFSLGCVLYELLTGRSPFSGDQDAAIMYSIANEDPSSIAKYRSGSFENVETIIQRALAKNPDDRYQSAREFKAAIDLLRSGSSGGQARSDRGARWQAARIWVVLAFLFVIAAFATWQARQGGELLMPEAQALAIVDFRDVSKPGSPSLSAGITGLLQVGLVENSPCRVLSPEYLYETRRRLFEGENGPISADQALEIARTCGATVLLSGQWYGEGSDQFVTWQLVDTRTGASLGAQRVEATALTALADGVIAGVMPVLLSQCGVASSVAPTSVTDITTVSEQAYSHYVMALEFGERSQFDRMTEELEKAVSIDSAFALAWFKLAKARGGYNEAPPGEGEAGCQAGERAWALRSRLGMKDRMLLEAWRARACRDDFAGALETNKEIVTRWPDDPSALNELCKMFAWAHMHSEVVRVAESGLKKYPDNPDLKESLARALGPIGRQKEQIELWKELATVQVDDPDNWDEMGRAYLALGSPDSAEVAFDRALAIEPGFIWSREGKAQTEARRGNNNEAIQQLRRIERSPDASYATRRLILGIKYGSYGVAQLYAASGRYRWAQAVLDSAAGGVPPIPLYRLYVNYFFVGEKDRKDALVAALGEGLESLEKAQTQDEIRGARWGIVGIALALDSVEVARPYFVAMQRAMKDDPWPNSFWPMTCSQVAVAEGRAQEALGLFEEVERMGIRRGDALFIIHRTGMARAYRMLGRYEEAAAILKELHRVNKSHWLAQYELGQVYQDMGRRDDAIAAYETFLGGWSEADEGLTQLVDARMQLEVLRGRAQ